MGGVDYGSATEVKLVGETGEVLPLSIDAKGRLVIGGTAVDVTLADTLVATIQAWQAKGTFGDLQAGATTARGYTIDEAAAEWKTRYLANKTNGAKIVIAGKTFTVIGVGPEFFYLHDGTQLTYAAASAYAVWQTDSKACGVTK